ncbi:RHS repeat-associated core domain-containing protein [Pseudomonas sp. JR33AA]|uniref:RHS repeat-associated core domain-containing protein n=1 Tax=Pseudomonas sp. JR33AA TaxID=2899113 RepID=UPI001F378E6D|nr:RHS repeat-associated core domain-containing protein [Pseudomonas sp. JR33AA]MCE5976235.1 RHS repeat-associated core domain-containing protein [Pseudomonas sp. JR33AA]
MSPAPDARQAGRQLFYCNSKIATELNGDACWRFLQANDLVLAQKDHQPSGFSSMLAASDQQRSILSIYERKRLESEAYSPYGHHNQGSGLRSLLAFSGERLDARSGLYHLGNGYRQFSPVMMRFCSPDSWSPFGAGGFNAYAYCAGDPINRTDPTGHFWGIGKFFRRLFRLKPKRPTVTKTFAPETQSATIQAAQTTLLPKAQQSGSGESQFMKGFNQVQIDEQFAIELQNKRSSTASITGQSQMITPVASQAPRPRKTLAERRSEQEQLNKKAAIQRALAELEEVNVRTRDGMSTSRDAIIIEQLQSNIRRWVD